MKASEVYLRAAKFAFEGGHKNIAAWSCVMVAGSESHLARLKHMREMLGDPYPDEHFSDRKYTPLLLCLMSAIAADEEKK